MYRQILVPLDGSKLAEQVIPYVRLLARGLGAQVQLLRVIEPLPPAGLTDPAREVYRQEMLTRLEQEAHDYLEAVAASLKEDGFTVSTTVQDGAPLSRPASFIVSQAIEDSATLIAMCSHGRSGINRWVLGSVADEVIRSSTSPLLVVRGKEEEELGAEVKLESVVVPLDGSPIAEQVLPHAASLAKALGLKMVLLWVFPLIEGHYTDIGIEATTYGVPMYGEVSQAVESEASRYFIAMEEELRRLGAPEVGAHLLWGQPASTIVDFAQDTPNDLVAMTTHGRSGIGRWLLGSVADRVIRHSGDPVLLIRAKE